MQRNTIEHFYKYMSLEVGRIVVEHRTLRWSTPGTLNDPYDMQFDLRIEVNQEAVREAALEKLWDGHYGQEQVPAGNILGVLVNALRGKFPKMSRDEFYREFAPAIDEGFARMMASLPRFQEETRTHIARSKILCLTVAPDNALMWSHYAGQHRGVVLRFRSVEGLDSPWPMAQPVQYLEDMPRLLDDDFLSDMASGRGSLNAETLLNRLTYTKSAEWAYEREWRLSTGLGRNPDEPHEDVPFHPQELDGVILGCRMPDEDRNWFLETVPRLYPHAAIQKAVRSADRFKLVLEPI